MRRDRRVRAAARVAAMALVTVLAAAPASARAWLAAPGHARAALDSAAAGDTVVLARGVHAGPLVLRRALVLRGEPGAVVDGGGRASVIEVGASGAVVQDLLVRGSGGSVQSEDAAVRVIAATGVTLRGVEISDALYGLYAERADGLRVEHSRLRGRVKPGSAVETSMEASAGNGIHLWYTNGARIDDCDVSAYMDGIYLSFAERTRITGTIVHDNGRYGLHTMYNQLNELEHNRFTRNVAGCALMFSNGLLVRDNTFLRNHGPRTYGLLLKDCSGGRFEGNRLVDNTIAVFMDNSNRNVFRGNLVQDNGWGLFVFSSCAKNEFAANDFVNNDYPVALDMRRTDNRFDDGAHGNFWSDAGVFDLDGDGAGDAPHSPVSAFAFLSKQMPDLSVLARSPAVLALSAAERAFPELRPSQALDRFPRVRPAGRRGADTREPGERSRPAWPAAGAFAALAAIGVATLRRGGPGPA